MRQHLTFVLLFLAKRHRIVLNESKERIVLTEQSLKDFLEESSQLIEPRGKNYSRRKRLLQFISKAIQIDWDGNGLLNRSKNTNRRSKRKRLMDIFEPVTLVILLLFLVIFIAILFILCNNMIIAFRNGTAFGRGTNAAITDQSEQRDRKCLNAFKRIPPIAVDRQKGDEREGEENEQLDCAICIELWIKGGHNACPFCRQELFNLQMTSPTLFACTNFCFYIEQRQSNGTVPNEAIVLEITNNGGTEREEGRTTADGAEIDQV
ncbi:hypothetical protein niasHT_009908 [Heterodera trifolii]|uniref:RING-type domain-containing protein n=1 Tax=Heterodera trifolii TaxID=157864 RepID=A0ABD2MD64_9BILA